MSNLLPKKLWHVGRSENIERVRLDEEKAKLLDEKTTEEANKSARLERLEVLRKRSKAETLVDGPPDYSLHESDSKSPRVDRAENLRVLDVCMSKDLSKKPWYSQDRGLRSANSEKSDEATKRRLDPVCHKESSVRPTTNNMNTVSTFEPKTIDQLRRERLTREANERQKAAQLLHRHHRHA